MKFVLTLLLALASISASAETVLITGANQGIGLEFARQYAARGWTVIATHRRDKDPEELAALKKPAEEVHHHQLGGRYRFSPAAHGRQLLVSHQQVGAQSGDATIDGLTMADTGRFLRPDGTDQPW